MASASDQMKNPVSAHDEEDDDEEFQDALNDLGHLALADEEDLSFHDAGLPSFTEETIYNRPSLRSDSESDRPEMSESTVAQPSGSRASIESTDSGTGDMSFSAGLHGSPTRDILNGPTHTPDAGTSHLCDSRDVNDNSLNDAAARGAEFRDFDLPSSSGMDDFTCDLPGVSDVTDDGAADDVSGEVSAAFEVDEEEECVRRLETQWTEEEKEEKKLEAISLKSRGNEAFKSGSLQEAEDLYTEALSLCPTCFTNDRSIIYSNRSACKLKKGEDESSLVDCTRALKLNPDYIKCLLRRAELYERVEKLDEALTDYKHVYELDRTVHLAAAAIMRLEQMITERNEKMKEEMLGQLKNLGNMILKPFGLSTENFQLQQNPDSGGYSINFNR